MPVYEYEAVLRDTPNQHREGTMIARNVVHAKDMLAIRGLTNVRLKQVKGITGFIRQLTADIR